MDRFVAAAASGGPGAAGLLIEGEAGLGKSMLWKAAIALARERFLQVLSCSPAAVEQTLPFVAVRDLLESVSTNELDRLPSPQHQALAAALLRLPAEEAVDPGAVGAALTRFSGDGPLMDPCFLP